MYLNYIESFMIRHTNFRINSYGWYIVVMFLINKEIQTDFRSNKEDGQILILSGFSIIFFSRIRPRSQRTTIIHIAFFYNTLVSLSFSQLSSLCSEFSYVSYYGSFTSRKFSFWSCLSIYLARCVSNIPKQYHLYCFIAMTIHWIREDGWAVRCSENLEKCSC